MAAPRRHHACAMHEKEATSERRILQLTKMNTIQEAAQTWDQGLRRQSFRHVALGGERKGNKVTASGRKGDEAGVSVYPPIGLLQESLLRRIRSMHDFTMI
jgi:hypothetical protein